MTLTRPARGPLFRKWAVCFVSGYGCPGSEWQASDDKKDMPRRATEEPQKHDVSYSPKIKPPVSFA